MSRGARSTLIGVVVTTVAIVLWSRSTAPIESVTSQSPTKGAICAVVGAGV